jgi:hypothetical protein
MKKQKATSKKSGTKATKRAASAKRNPTTTGNEPSAPSGSAEQVSDAMTSRVPPVGTVITKLDRHGSVRCRCTVEETGIRYKNRIFKSLSGAAMAAADDLGLKNKTQNGFTFWGLTKPARKLADPVAALKTSWKRFHGVAAIVTLAATDQNRGKIRAGLEEQKESIENLLAQVAS